MSAEVGFRPAAREDAREIAELFLMASGGVAGYVWSTMRAQYPGLELMEIGARRYASEEGNLSYRNSTIAEAGGRVAGIMHAYAIPEAPAPGGSGEPGDPVLAPYARPDVPGSLYVHALACFPQHRGRGLGTRLLDRAREMARERGCGELSLRVFEENEGALRLYRRHGFEVVDRAAVVPHELISYAGDVLLMKAAI